MTNNLKWFPGDFALHYSSEEFINIFLRQIIAHLSLIIFPYRERSYSFIFKRLLGSTIPIPSSCLHCLFCHRKIFLSHCFIVSKWTDLMWEKFSPFLCSNHVVYDLSRQIFVFLGRIGFIEDDIFSMSHTRTKKYIFSATTPLRIKSLFLSAKNCITKGSMIGTISETKTLITQLQTRSSPTIHVHTITTILTLKHIVTIPGFLDVKRIVDVFIFTEIIT